MSLLQEAATPVGTGTLDLPRHVAMPFRVSGSGMVTAVVSVTATTLISTAAGGISRFLYEICSLRKWLKAEI